jgi:hypothetical protein
MWRHKTGLYWWWAVRAIEDFSSIWLQRHARMTATVTLLGIKYDLETTHLPKNNLTDAELVLFFKQLFKFETGMAKWKLHYLAWVFTYITGVRPGTITIAPGYGKGGDTGVAGVFVREDQTLRWEDVSFTRPNLLEKELGTTKGIIVRIKFRYNKGLRSGYTPKSILGHKEFTFLPTRGNRLECDVSALAFERGLFAYASLDDIHADTNRGVIPTIQAIPKQAVFVAATQANSIDVSKSMRENALNDKLQEM